MEHELKIIYKFNPNDGYLSGNRTEIYLDNIQLGAVKDILFKATSENWDPPKIIINYSVNSPENFLLKTSLNLAPLKVIKSNILELFKKHINLKAFL